MKKTRVIELLKYWLRTKDELYADFAEHVVDTGEKKRIFIDNNSDVLLVAHIDTVHTPKLKKHDKNKIWAAGLDDRLGCAIAHELSKYLKVDLLITDFEESAKSTGQYHDLKDYNWIAEFDRNGGDVVTYDIDSQEFLENLNEFFTVGFGSFSDLCFLDTKACCVNVGIGYKHDHSEDSYVDINVMNAQIERFRKFYYKYKNTKFVADNAYAKYSRFGGSYYDQHNYTEHHGWERDIYDGYAECDFCGNYAGKEIYGTRICQECFEAITATHLYESWQQESMGGHS